MPDGLWGGLSQAGFGEQSRCASFSSQEAATRSEEHGAEKAKTTDCPARLTTTSLQDWAARVNSYETLLTSTHTA